MSYLVTADYKTGIKDETLSAITQGDSSMLAEAELQAQSQIESYLNQRYDVANIFNKTGNDRSPILVMYMRDMVLYHIEARLGKREMPEVRMARYDAAIKWLEMVAKGSLTPDLPRKIDSSTADLTEQFRIASNPKLTHQW